VHLIDPLHQCFGEVMPTAVVALGDKFYVQDNTQTPDTLQATFYYPKFLTTYESRTCNPLPLFGRNQGAGTTIHGTEEDLREFADLLEILKHKVGRILFNGYPTGVEVCHAMVHGGPYPASTDSRATSVGSQAIFRFARPVCYQDFPDTALPAELKDGNPLGIWRMVDGNFTR